LAARKTRPCRRGFLRRGSGQPYRHGRPVESHVAAEPQARNWIAAAPTGLFVDPGFGHLEPGGKFFGSDNVFRFHRICGSFGPRGCGALASALRMVEIPRHVIPFPVGCRHHGAPQRSGGPWWGTTGRVMRGQGRLQYAKWRSGKDVEGKGSIDGCTTPDFVQSRTGFVASTIHWN